MIDKTIIYYTSNKENAHFENKIIEDLKNKAKTFSIPIISVSQKPMDLGHNICVGDVGLSYLNEFRQMYIAACKAKTDYLIVAESDFLYPNDYFLFKPKVLGGCYRYGNIYIVFNSPKHDFFYKKYESEGAQIVDRKLFIKKCEEFFVGMPEWYKDGKGGVMPIKRREPLSQVPRTFFTSDVPAITFKTGNGVAWDAHILSGQEQTSVPYWGTIEEVKVKFLLN